MPPHNGEARPVARGNGFNITESLAPATPPGATPAVERWKPWVEESAEFVAPLPAALFPTLVSSAAPSPVAPFPAAPSPAVSSSSEPPSPRESMATVLDAQINASRNTVLPRLEIIGDEPTLVVEGKRRFENIRPLGVGGIGEVVSAQDNDIGRPVALKRLRADMQSAAALGRFVDEIRTTGRLEHPNVVPIHDVGLDEDGRYYFVMKYVDGETLESIIAKLAAADPDYHQRYPFERRVQIFLDILDAVGFAHRRGIIHRDIKPANVMIGPHGEVLVMDWGIAKSLREPSASEALASKLPPAMAAATLSGRAVETVAGTLIGTPAYMSPEQAAGAPLDERSDIYSLCVLFHELLNLRHYLADKTTVSDTLAGVIGQRQPLPLHFTGSRPVQGVVPADLAWFVHRGLNKDPNKRFASVAEMQQYLHLRAEGCIRIQCFSTLLKRIFNELGRITDRHPFIMPTLVFGGWIVVIVLLIQRAFSS